MGFRTSSGLAGSCHRGHEVRWPCCCCCCPQYTAPAACPQPAALISSLSWAGVGPCDIQPVYTIHYGTSSQSCGHVASVDTGEDWHLYSLLPVRAAKVSMCHHRPPHVILTPLNCIDFLITEGKTACFTPGYFPEHYICHLGHLQPVEGGWRAFLATGCVGWDQ